MNRFFGIRHLHISRRTPCLAPSPCHTKKKMHKHCFKTSIKYPRKFRNNGLTKFWHENVVYYQMGDVQIANDGNLRSQGGVWTINVPAIMQ